jgi:hypothetical protein
MAKKVQASAQPTESSGWKVQKLGGKRSASVIESKTNAILSAYRLTKPQSSGQLVSHQRDGSFQKVGGIYHVIQDLQESWRVIRSGASRATLVTASKQEAVKGAQQKAKKHASDIYIHKKDATISRVDSYKAESHRFQKSK